MNEMYQAAEAELYILASIGLRTALDRVAEFRGIDAELPMKVKVAKLMEGGWIGETEKQTLDVVADAGNAAAHRGWSPNAADFSVFLRTLEQFIERTVVNPKAALALASIVPARPKQKVNKVDGSR